MRRTLVLMAAGGLMTATGLVGSASHGRALASDCPLRAACGWTLANYTGTMGQVTTTPSKCVAMTLHSVSDRASFRLYVYAVAGCTGTPKLTVQPGQSISSLAFTGYSMNAGPVAAPACPPPQPPGGCVAR